MKSVKCVACGFVGWADQETCKKCGASLAPAPVQTQSQPAQSNFQQPTPSYSGHQPSYQHLPPRSQNLKQGLAITSLVLGCLNFPTIGFLGIGAVTGLMLGIVALRNARKRPQMYGGQGLAIAGVVTNGFYLLLFFPIVMAIAIPNIFASYRAANEGSAIASLRSIAEAESTYYGRRQEFGTLEDLSAAQLVRPEIANGTHNGYRFGVRRSSNGNGVLNTFEATAVPVDFGKSGRRSFLIDETGVVRAADVGGREATRSARPLEDRGSPRGDDD
jgi:hypothetical protein